MLLTRYVEERYAQAPAAEQAAFHELLELQDPSLYAYCMGQESAPTAPLAALVERITGRTPHDP